MNKTLLTIGLFVLGSTITFSQNKSLKEKFASKTSQNKETDKEKSLTRAIVFRPGYSANYYWFSGATDWTLSDTSHYEYNSEGYETSNLRTNNGFINSRNLKTYDSNDREIENLTQYYDDINMVFVNSGRNVRVYDAQGNQIESRYENWNLTSSLWEISSGNMNAKTYDANNNVIESISQNYNSTSETYENSYRYVSTYDASNNLLTEEYFDWDTTVWIAEGKDIYIYTNDVLTTYQYQDWNGTAYENSDRYIDIVWLDWTNIDESDLLSFTYQEWDSTNWVTTGRLTATYDEYGGSIEIFEDYINSVWVNSNKNSNFYDSHLNRTGSRDENWENNAWVIDYESRTTYTYDVDDHITRKIQEYWNNTTLMLENQSRTDYGDYVSYSNSVSIDEINKSITVKIYPNPVISKGNIEINSSNLSDKARFILSDLTGKEVLNLKASSEFSFDRANLKSGFYTFKIIDNSNLLTTGKIILE